MVQILAILFLFGGGSLVAIAYSPVGRAIADRIRGGAPPETDPALSEEVERMREELAELHERVDFAERLLATQRERDALPEGR